MAAAAVATVFGLILSAGNIVKMVADPFMRQFNYLCCLTSNIDSLEEEEEKLDNAVAGLQREIDRKRKNLEDPVDEVESWLTKSKKMKVEITGIRTEASTVEPGLCSKIGSCCLSRRAKKTTESAQKLLGEKPIATFRPRSNAARVGGQSGKSLFECESRNKIEEDIMTALRKTLRDGDEKNIGICGMGGLGKTTMATKIMIRALQENVFQEAVIATVSEKVDISKIQDEIGRQLGLDKLKQETSQSGRAQLLRSRLSDTKITTLLVLDDVWETLELEEFGIPRDSKGCTILFTSRNRDDLRKMGVKISFGMIELSEEEAWSFFKERAGPCVDDMKLKPTAKKVAKECGGLPINLAAVAVGLYDEHDAGIWQDTLRKLEENVPDNVQYKKPLRWSYDRLNSEEAQFLFLLCCLFPEDADIPLDYLTSFCMGLRGMPKGIRNVQAARNNMRTLAKFLKDRSLLLESDEEDCVRMHDVVRDVCTYIAKERGYIVEDGCTWISSSHLLSGSRCPKLRLLFLDGTYDDPLGFKFDDAFLEGMTELNVLCIQNYRSLTRMPYPTQSLGNLKTLISVSCDELETISVVGELENLEILICRSCGSIKELPTEMKRLKCLKLLELTWCLDLRSIDRGIISSLIGLEELKMYMSFRGWEAEEREERENASIKELEALHNLACLQIDIKDASLVAENMPLLSKKEIVRFIIRTDMLQNIPSEFSQAISLKLERETRLGDWIEMQLVRDTECLYLRGDGANNVDLAKLQNIRLLEMGNCESLKSIVRTSGGTVFPLIEYLELFSLPELQEICDGPISSTFFHNLKKLVLKYLGALTQFWKSSSLCQNIYVPHFSNLSSIEIYQCDSLRNLGQLSMAGKDCLPQLEKLDISFCEMMEQVFLWKDDEDAAGKNKNSILITKVFPKLKEVELLWLPNLNTFYQGIKGIEFALLMEMKIRECPKLKSIIGSNADIDDDGSLHLFCQPQKISFGSSFKVLEIDYNPFCGHEISSSLFNGLEAIKIHKCEGSMSLFTLSVAANLVSLIKLVVEDCGDMIKVIEDAQLQERILLFPKLKELKLSGLPNLVSFCDWKCDVKLPSLTKVEIEYCSNMKHFIFGLVATPKLEAFTTDLSTYVGVGAFTPKEVAFDGLKELEIRGNDYPLNDDKISVSLFNGLEKLKFTMMYRGSMSLFSSSVAGTLVKLRVLEIEDCREIVKVVEHDEEKEDDEKVVLSGGEITSVVFPKLEELTMRRLRNLVRFCEWKCKVELPSLTKVEIKECPNMESFSMGFVSAPKLKIVNINWREIEATKDLNGALQQHYLAHQQKEEE